MSFVLIIGKLLRKYYLKINIKLVNNTQKLLKEIITILDQETGEQDEKLVAFLKN